MTPKRLFIFDIDGTLTDSTEVDDKCFSRIFQQHFNVILDEFDYTDFKNVTDWGITEELFEITKKHSITPHEIEQFKIVFLEDLSKESKLNPKQFTAVKGAVDFLNSLKQQDNIEIAIATGAWGESAEIKLKTGEIPYAGLPLSHSNLFKSRAEIMTHAIQMAKIQYNYDFQDITYFGDGKWDFITCANLQIPFVGIDCHQNGKLKKLGANRVYKDFSSMNYHEIWK